MSRTAALRELDDYARMTLRHSYNQYAKHGTLHSKALEAFEDDSVWRHPWVPDDLDIGEAADHPVYQERFTPEQRLAWNHLQWGLEYTRVAGGERQIIVLNNYAVKRYANVLPSIVELERRESFEEVDHIDAFMVVLEGLRSRYFPNLDQAVWSSPASGFSSERLNQIVRHGIGMLAHRVLGANFPTLFFLTRGMKTHDFKPLENAIASNPDGHQGLKTISHLHRLDESRHMATALNLARLSNLVLDELPRESRWVIKAAIRAAWPPGRLVEYRIAYWRTVLEKSPTFANLAKEEREALLDHIRERTTRRAEGAMHERQQKLTRMANKRIVEECGLDAETKRFFVEELRADPVYRHFVEAVELEPS